MRKNRATRIFWMIVSVIINALGVAMITTTNLGTVPATSISNVLGIAYAPSIGAFTFVLSVIQVVLQIIILRRDFPPLQILQLAPAMVLSYFIDAFLLVVGKIPLDTYPAKLVMLLAGCVVLGFSIALEVHVDILYLPLDGFNKALFLVTHKDFDVIKTIVDCVMVAVAIVLSFVLMGRLEGVREGTVIAAVLCGMIVRLFSKTVFKNKEAVS